MLGSLNFLLKNDAKYNFNDLDLLYIDAEGYDGKIVKDFLKTNKSRPFIIFEYIHVDNDFFDELLKIKKESENPGITIVPLKIFINQSGFAKIQISIAKGKKNYDKRQAIKCREAKIKISRLMKKN